MLTRDRASATETDRPPGWPETRFWIGTFGVFVTTLVLALVAVTFLLALVLDYRPVVILSGSMEPGISVGDVVLYEQSGIDDIGGSTVVVFDDPVIEDGTVIHRVVAVDPETGWLQTKGDRNSNVDSSWVTEETINGVGRVLIPYVGIPAAWIQTGRFVFAVALIGFIVVAAWAARWGWNTRFDPWARPVDEGPGQ